MAISNNSTGLRPGVCTSTTRPTAPYEGQHIYETDTDFEFVWNGSAWISPSFVSTVLTGTPTAPTAAAGTNTTQLATMASRPWNIAWGAVGFISRTSNITIGGNTTVLSTSFTAVTGRLYKITHYEPLLYNSGGGYTIFYIKEGTTLLKESYMPNKTANEPAGWMEMHVGTFTAGTKTINIVGTSTNVSPTNNNATGASHLLIEDIGPA